MRYAFLFLFFVSSAFAQAPEGVDPLSPIPEEAELTYSRKVVAEVFGDQIRAARTIGEKSALAEDILNLAKKTKKPFEQYALIEQAQELAIDAKNLNFALQVLDLLAKNFKVDKETMRKQLTADLAGGSKTSAKMIKQFEALDAIAKANPAKIRAVADTYYKLTKTLRGPFQQTAKERAIKYYTDAMPMMSALEKRKAEGRIKELKKLRSGRTATYGLRGKRNADLNALIGTWEGASYGSEYKANWIFKDDGTVYQEREKVTGQWTVQTDSIFIRWPNGFSARLRRPIDPQGTIGDSSKKGNVAFALKKKK